MTHRLTSFGPNMNLLVDLEVLGSHRDESFKVLYEKTRNALQQIFSLSDFELFFLPGGGTTAVESIIYSSRLPVHVVGTQGVFTTRWREMAQLHNRTKKGQPIELSCLLETSASVYQDSQTQLVDVVSSFPYYEIPATCDIFALASNKLLGGLAGLAIVGVREGKFDSYFRESEMSTLSLRRYRQYGQDFQTPSTIGTYLFDVLHKSVTQFDLQGLRHRIDHVCDQIVDVLGDSAVIGDSRGPVLTLRADALPLFVLDKWTLYEKFTDTAVVQIFTYSEPEEKYDAFIDDLRRHK